MGLRRPTARRLTFIFAAAGCALLLGADPDSGKARIALFEPAGQKEDAALAAVLSMVASSVELSLDVLQRWDVKRLPAADPVKDLERVRAYCQANRIDQAILGSGSARSGGGYQFTLVVYDRRTDAITITQKGASKGALDMFDVTDTLVGSLLDGLSGTHILLGSLSVDSEPEGATITVNGREVGSAPLSLRGMPVGTLQVVGRTAGREETKAEVAIADGETASTTLKLARSVGILDVTMPGDAAAVVRSAEIGEKHLAGPGSASLPTGEYEVQASCAGLPPVTGRVEVTRNGETKWLPWPKGYLVVQAEPADATIVVDGQERGAAPQVVDVEPGVLHRVELKRDKYVTYGADVSGAAGEKTEFAGRLTPLPGSIRVETSMPGALVHLDDDQFGTTPFVFENVQPGTHTLLVEVLRVGKRMYTVGGPTTVEVNPAETTLVTKTFREGTVHLTVADAPVGSAVEIDGAPVDSAQALSTGIDTPAGSFDITVRSPSLQTWTAGLFLGPGFTTSRSVHSMTMLLPRRTIALDGKTDDWAGIEPVLDLSLSQALFMGDRRYSVTRLYMCRDDKNLYWRVDFAGANPLQRPPRQIRREIICQLDVHIGSGNDLNLGESYVSSENRANAWTSIWSNTTRRGTRQSSDEAFRNTDTTTVVRIPMDRVLKNVKTPVSFQLDLANFGDSGKEPGGFLSEPVSVDFTK